MSRIGVPDHAPPFLATFPTRPLSSSTAQPPTCTASCQSASNAARSASSAWRAAALASRVAFDFAMAARFAEAFASRLALALADSSNTQPLSQLTITTVSRRCSRKDLLDGLADPDNVAAGLQGYLKALHPTKTDR